MSEYEYIYKIVTDKDGVDCYIKTGQIVWCKDCKWYDLTDPCGTLTPTAHRCKRVTRLWMEDDAYCSYGERREDAETL